MSPPPPRGQARIVGGLLGSAGGESWQGARGGFEDECHLTWALLDLCRSYAVPGAPSPAEVARSHAGLPGPGWLLPVALVRRHPRHLVSDTLELAITAGSPRSALKTCIAYVELAAALFAGTPPGEAVRQVTGRQLSPPTSEPPLLCGIPSADALTASIWALGQPGSMYDVVASLVHYAEPSVAAAAAALLGLRDGCAGVPAQWHRCVPSAGECRELAASLAGPAGAVPLSGSSSTLSPPIVGGAGSPGTTAGVGSVRLPLVVMS